jgi:Mg-chelatase subunit ChlD
LSKALEQAKAGDNHRRALAGRLAFATDLSWARLAIAAHTLPTSEYFRACDSGQSQQIHALWKSLIDSSDGTAKSIIEQSGQRELARKLSETQFLAAIRQQGVRSLWKLEFGQVIERRNLAEELAVPRGSKGIPGDERAHYYARYVAEDADEKRRLAEDSLFVGEQNALHQYEAYAAQADELYKTTSEVMDDASAAFGALDRAFAETPYLAQWLCSPLAAERAGRDERVNSELDSLIRSARALSEEINRIKEPQVPGLAFRDQASRLTANFTALKSNFAETVGRLKQGDAQGAAGWRAIETALLAPLISGDDRETLLKNRADISRALHQEYFDPERNDAADDNPAPNYLEVMGEWRNHPLLAILQFDDSQVEKAEERRWAWCDETAADVRNRLQSRIDPSQFDEAAPPASANAVFQERQKFSRAEQMLRAMAPLGYDVSDRPSDPIAELRRFDIQQLLIWHGGRAIEDFWEDVANPLADRPFFEQAAKDFLQAANGVREQAGPAVKDQMKLQQQSLEKRLQASRERMQITAESQLVNEPTAPVTVSLTVQTNSPKSDYPPGIAALYLRDQARRLTAVQFEEPPRGKNQFVNLRSQGGRPQHFKLTVREASSMLNAVAFFRGRDFSEEFNLRTRDGIRVDYPPHRYRDQSITLSGERRRQLSIIFILDCSWSMTDRGLMEGAKDALTKMLGEIATRNRRRGEGTRVGVRFYGHRARWSNATPPKRDYQTDWKPIPANLAPSLDVEIIRPLGEFNENAAAQVGRSIDAVQGFGQTPLYVALIQALDGFEADPPGTEKLIVAITDGRDDVWEPTEIARAIPKKVKADVLETWNRRPIAIHIVGFNIVGTTGELAEIAEKSGGRYWDVRSGTELLAKLRERLEMGGYSVREVLPQTVSATNRGEPIEAALNEPVNIANVNPPPKNFIVAFRSAEKSVSLEGGEALELQVAPDQETPDIWAVEYPPPAAAKANLIVGDTGRTTDYLLRVHKPLREESSATFPISIQRMPLNRQHFTPRPAETWVEITPLPEDGSTAEPYVFYDRNFEPHTPVPVLRWTALDWPETAGAARIRFWCKYNKTPGKSLHEVISSGGTIGGVELLPEASTENGLYRIQVIERHGPQSPGIDSLRIQVEPDSRVLPSRVVHEFDRQNDFVTHSFYFSAESRARLSQPAASRITVTEAGQIKEGALQLPKDSGIEVSIKDSGELLSPSSSAGEQ